MYHVYKLPLQTQFHCYNYDGTWNNLQKQQYAYSGGSLLCFLQAVLILSMHAVWYKTCDVCELSNNG